MGSPPVTDVVASIEYLRTAQDTSAAADFRAAAAQLALTVDDGLPLLDDDPANRLLTALLRSYLRTREVRDLILQPDGREPIVIGAGGPVVAGPGLDIVGWLSGRGDGSGLRTAGGLPELGSW
jgi:hypothetical protein